MPPSWDGEGVQRPANTHFVRHVNAELPGARLPAWFHQLPDRPTVLASLGTVFNKTPGVLEAIVEGLAGESFNAIVAIGRDQDPSRFGRPPANVRLEASVPQAAMLARCELFITHGGFNSVKESLVTGVPMVVIPITADQPYSAQRCVALGVAEAIPPTERTPARIRAATEKVFGDSTYRASAQAFAAEMATLPGPGRLVELLEALDRQTVIQ
jgi:MGT family glycosyltransferase